MPQVQRTLLRICLAVAVLLAMLHIAGHRRALAAHDPAAMSGHMKMTALRTAQPGDQQRAAEIAAAARKAAEPYSDFHKALADGYVIFHPELPQPVYHFTNHQQALRNTLNFDPAHPTSLLYERTKPARNGEQPEYKLVGVMYTAPFRATDDDLNQRIPLSVTRWHLHTNLCLPPEGERADLLSPKPRFGLTGSITTLEACDTAGGTFLPHIFGWMVHVYPFESDPAKIWASGMDDDHGMDHDKMADMPM